ncbi:Imm52 family immunity protein [Archangium violaceum]|uniref:Imm52 family immunity protein n=1 Tax=Archangium violaceum TaxID=83451 RepID=UPI0037BF72F7
MRRGLLLSAPALAARPAHRLWPARDHRRARPSSTLKQPQHVVRRTGTPEEGAGRERLLLAPVLTEVLTGVASAWDPDFAMASST